MIVLSRRIAGRWIGPRSLQQRALLDGIILACAAWPRCLAGHLSPNVAVDGSSPANRRRRRPRRARADGGSGHATRGSSPALRHWPAGIDGPVDADMDLATVGQSDSP